MRLRFSKLVLSFVVVLVFCTANFAVECARANPAEELIATFRATVSELKSYSYECRRFDEGDEYVTTRHSEAMAEYKPLLDKIALVTRKDMSPVSKERYETVSEYQFVAPFRVQVKLAVNDYLPELLAGAEVFFSPEDNDDVIFLKEPLVGLKFKKPADNDSATVLVTNWTYDMLELDCALANGGEISLGAIEMVGDVDTAVVKVSLKTGKIPWAVPCAQENYGVPETVWPQLNRELGMTEKRINDFSDRKGFIIYYIDPDFGLPIKKTIVFDDLIAVEQTLSNIELNGVVEKKLYRVRKKK